MQKHHTIPATTVLVVHVTWYMIPGMKNEQPNSYPYITKCERWIDLLLLCIDVVLSDRLVVLLDVMSTLDDFITCAAHNNSEW